MQRIIRIAMSLSGIYGRALVTEGTRVIYEAEEVFGTKRDAFRIVKELAKLFDANSLVAKSTISANKIMPMMLPVDQAMFFHGVFNPQLAKQKMAELERGARNIHGSKAVRDAALFGLGLIVNLTNEALKTGAHLRKCDRYVDPTDWFLACTGYVFDPKDQERVLKTG